VITHTVLISFTEPADVPEAKSRLEALPAQIDDIRSLWVGLDVVRTESSYDLVLVTTHDDVTGLVAYQGHPVHQEFLAWLKPRLAARAVVDAES
jgi:Stress responsive A/B Barrel Domain